jgi:hypothetical protein
MFESQFGGVCGRVESLAMMVADGLAGCPLKGACVAVAAALALLLPAPVLAGTPQDRLERERLQLEVEQRQRDVSWQADVQRWLPAASALVAFAVALYGVFRYFDERRQAREIRTEEGVAHNLERLIDRPTDGTSPNARAIAALRNLDGLARTGSGTATGHRLRVTDAVTALVRDDLTVLQTPDDARLPVICVDHWADFENQLARDPDLCRVVVERYLAAMERLATESPPYVRSARRENGRYVAPEGRLSPQDALLFATLVRGFKRYVDLLPDGEVREESIGTFSRMAETLGAQMFPSR